MNSPFTRRTLLACASMAPVSRAFAQPARFVEGSHYVAVPANALAQEQRSAGAPMVTEVFWYGCPHCHEFDPLLNDWVAERGESIAFSRVPAVWDAATRAHARLFAATLELGIHAQVHESIFVAIHEHQNFLLDEASQVAFLENAGVDASAIIRALGSFQVDSQVRRAESLVREMRVPGIPALVVGGRYMVRSGSAVRTYPDALRVADYLLTQIA